MFLNDAVAIVIFMLRCLNSSCYNRGYYLCKHVLKIHSNPCHKIDNIFIRTSDYVHNDTFDKIRQ